MAKQTAVPVQLTATPSVSGPATANQPAIGDRIADELVEAIELGIDADEYCAARGAGATHAECLTIWKDQLCGFSEYAETRQAGITHVEATEVVGRAANLRYYTAARQHGATHGEIIEVIDRQVNLWYYASARKSGATHAEALERALR